MDNRIVNSSRNRIDDESSKNNLTKEILKVTLDTYDTAVNSYNELFRQEEQLINADKKLSNIDDNLNKTETNLRNMRSFWYRFASFFTSDSYSDEPEPTIIKNTTPITNDYYIDDANNANSEDDLDQILDVVKRIKHSAEMMSDLSNE
jgi:hypothetical protein